MYMPHPVDVKRGQECQICLIVLTVGQNERNPIFLVSKGKNGMQIFQPFQTQDKLKLKKTFKFCTFLILQDNENNFA